MTRKTLVEDCIITDSATGMCSIAQDIPPADLPRELSLRSSEGSKSARRVGLVSEATTTGRVINAVFCIPHTVHLSKDAQWVSHARLPIVSTVF